MGTHWGYTIFVIIALGLVALVFAGFLRSGSYSEGNTALIYISGDITADEQNGFFNGGSTSASTLVPLIEKASENPSIEAILIEINSGGGSPVGSEEISSAIKRANKTKVCLIREIGASGAYWAASACDVIIASRMSYVGSIGVYGSYLEYSGLMQKYGVSYEQMNAGKYKDMENPYEPLSEEEKAIVQKDLNTMHTYFLSEIAKNRNLTANQTAEISEARIYLGEEALKLGLIDEIGDMQSAKAAVKKSINKTAIIVKYEKKMSFAELISSMFNKASFTIGRGMASAFLDEQGLKIRT